MNVPDDESVTREAIWSKLSAAASPWTPETTRPVKRSAPATRRRALSTQALMASYNPRFLQNERGPHPLIILSRVPLTEAGCAGSNLVSRSSGSSNPEPVCGHQVPSSDAILHRACHVFTVEFLKSTNHHKLTLDHPHPQFSPDMVNIN
jgi:hypothetical protein